MTKQQAAVKTQGKVKSDTKRTVWRELKRSGVKQNKKYDVYEFHFTEKL